MENIIKNSEGKDFNLVNENGVFLPVDADTGYSLLFDVMNNNGIEFVIGTKNENFVEILLEKENANLVQALSKDIDTTSEFIQGKYFMSNPEIRVINFGLSIEFNKKKMFGEEAYLSHYVLGFKQGNKVSYEGSDIYLIDSDMEIDKGEFVLMNAETLPTFNKISAQNSLFRILFNNDGYFENVSSVQDSFREYGYGEQFKTILDTNIYSTLKKTRYSNLFTVNMNDLILVNDYDDFIEFDEYEIREVFGKDSQEILAEFNVDTEFVQIKETDYYIHTLYFLNMLSIHVANGFDMELTNESREQFSVKMNVLDSILFPMFGKYLEKADSDEMVSKIVEQYMKTLLK